MADRFSDELRKLGRAITPGMIEGTVELYAPLHDREPFVGITIERDISYGEHERQRLDLFRETESFSGPKAVLVFVHGGGFVGGDKRRPDTPFFDNIGSWAVRNNLVGINMTYRLAPDHPWPAGSEDVAAVIDWVKQHGPEHGIDPGRIYLLGQSAGAGHTSGYIARPGEFRSGGHGLAGAIFLSGIYNPATMEQTEPLKAYYGSDPALCAERSAVDKLSQSELPLMVALAEMDPPAFERQGLELLSALQQRDGHLPRFVHQMGHNHISPVLGLGLERDVLGRNILEFIQGGR